MFPRTGSRNGALSLTVGVFGIAAVMISALPSSAQYTFYAPPGAVASNPTSLNGLDGNLYYGTYLDINNNSHGFTYDTTAHIYAQFDNPLGGSSGSPSFPQGTLVSGVSSGVVVGSFIDSSNGQYAYYGSGGTYNTIDATTFDATAIPTVSTPFTAGKGVSGNYIVGYYGRDFIGAFFNSLPSSSGFVYDTSTNTFTEVDQPQTLLDAAASASNGTQLNGVYGSTAVGLFYDGSGIEHGLIYDITGNIYTQIDDPAASEGTYLTGINGDYAVGEYISGGASYGFMYDMVTQVFTNLLSPDASSTAYFTGIAATNNSNPYPILTGYAIDRYGEYSAFSYQYVTPEPGTYGLFAGLLTAGLAARRRRKK